MADKKKKVRSVKDTPRHKVGVVLGTGFFVILCAIIVFPVFAGLLASFRPGKELIRRGLSIDLDFSTMSLDNYTYLFSGNADSQKYFMWYKNSLIITIVSVVLTLLICYFVAYGLTMYNYRLKNFLFFLVIATMMVPFEILMLPLYKEIIAIGLIDSYVGVIITGLCSASTIFFFKQYLSGLPKDLLDAARIDGCNHFMIFSRIMFPLVKPGLVALAILTLRSAWNDLMWPMIVNTSPEKMTLSAGLSYLQGQYATDYPVMMAGAVLAVLPLLILFALFQKQFIEGIAMTDGK